MVYFSHRPTGQSTALFCFPIWKKFGSFGTLKRRKDPMMKQTGNRHVKDSIFRYLFSEEKNFAALYYDITGKILAPEDLAPYNTDSLVVTQLRNDVAMITKDKRLIVMVEHQSTLSENMPLRFLFYYLELLKLHIVENQLNLFARKAIALPRPEFYVVYNGREELPGEVLALSANFEQAEAFLEVQVKAVDIRYDHLPRATKEREDVLDGYSYLMDRIRFFHQVDKLPLQEAIDRAIGDTKRRGYLLEYLDRKEFITLMQKVLTIEEQMDLIREEERKYGREEGERKKALAMAQKALAEGLSVEMIHRLTGLSPEEIETLEKE